MPRIRKTRPRKKNGPELPRATSKPREEDELKLLKLIGRRIHFDLHRLGKPVEWLAFESETSRATVRRVFDADRNIGVVTLHRIAKALGYAGVVQFFKGL